MAESCLLKGPPIIETFDQGRFVRYREVVERYARQLMRASDEIGAMRWERWWSDSTLETTGEKERRTMTVGELVIDAIAEYVGVDPSLVVPESILRSDLHADSITIIEIILVIEDALGIEIPVENLDFAQTAQSLTGYLAERGFAPDAEAPELARRHRHPA